MKAPLFRSLRVADLQPADFNPEGRVKKENIRDLIDSMSRSGILYPILVSIDNKVIDGHRRLAAAKELGWDVIPAFVTDGEADEVYATVNATSRKMSGADALQVWLKRPLAVTPLLRSRFENMNAVLGPKRVAAIVKAGYSLRLFNRAKQVAKYCESTDQDTICQILDWMLEHPVTTIVESAMAQGQKPAIIMRAVKSNRPMRMTATIS